MYLVFNREQEVTEQVFGIKLVVIFVHDLHCKISKLLQVFNKGGFGFRQAFCLIYNFLTNGVEIVEQIMSAGRACRFSS